MPTYLTDGSGNRLTDDDGNRLIASMTRIFALSFGSSGGGPTFPTLPGLAGRWNALAANVAVDGSNNVTSVADLSGNGHPLTPSGVGVPWSATGWTGSLGSKPAFVFNASNSLLSATSVPMGTAAQGYCFTVLQMLSGTADFGGAVTYGSSSQNDFNGANSAALLTRTAGANTIISQSGIYSNVSCSVSLATNYRIGVNIGDAGGGAAVDLYLNNAFQATNGVSGTFATNGTIVVGGRYISGAPDPTSQPWSGAICEVVVGSGFLSSGELNALDAYFTAQWGT